MSTDAQVEAGKHERVIDRSDAADAARFRWLLSGYGYFMEENYLCGHAPTSIEEQDAARAEIDKMVGGEELGG